MLICENYFDICFRDLILKIECKWDFINISFVKSEFFFYFRWDLKKIFIKSWNLLNADSTVFIFKDNKKKAIKMAIKKI